MHLSDRKSNMLSLSWRRRRKTSGPIMASCLACFSLPLRRNSTIYHNSALSERVIEEDEKQKQMMMVMGICIEDHLPDNLMLEIFQRLPLKSVFRAKSVSKRWNLLINDPLFPECYRRHNHSSSPPFALFYSGFIPETNHPCQIGPYFPSSQHYSTFPLNFFTTQLRILQKDIRSLHLIGCSSDLLLFSGFPHNLYVCNPLTFSWFTLQHPPRHCSRYPVIGFMLEPDHATFWIVQILATGSPSLVFQVYCSATAKWSSNQLTTPGRFNSFAMKTTQVYQGSIVWMLENGLLLYNPRTAILKVSALPNDRIRRSGIIAVSCGLLHYYELTRYDPALRVWAMLMSGEWVLKHVLRHDHFWSGDAVVPETRTYLRWVCCNPNDCDVVFLKCDDKLVTCKLSSGCLELVPCDEKEGVFYRVEWDVMPLLFSPWPTTACLV